jgi:DNA-directed RNA polymerase specialized sigma24 family protein
LIAEPPVDHQRLIEYAVKALRESGLDPQQAEDVVQEAWMGWIEHFDEIQVQAHLGYLHTSIRNGVADLRRRNSGARPHDPLEERHLSLDADWARGGS